MTTGDDAIGLELAQCIETDAQLIMAWRNDPDTLKASFNQAPKQWPGFYSEYLQDYFSTAYLPPLFATYQGNRVAFLRFRTMQDPEKIGRLGSDISINISPEYRGKGFAASILKAAITFARSQGYDDLFAEIKPENKASVKAFEKAGFQLMKQGATPKYVVRLTPLELSEHPVFVIAEAGSNWRMGTPERDLAMAKALIDVAVDAKADAVKFQTYRPDTVYVENAGQAHYLADQGMKQEIRDIFSDLSMPYEMVEKLASYCTEKGIQFMSSPFSKSDFEAVDPYVSVHKIASYELSHLRLLELAAESGKPLILSTGAANLSDIAWAVETFRSRSSAPLTLLQCTAKYPCDASSLNLRSLSTLKTRFGCAVGLSDHSRDPVLAPVTAVGLGASVIEKHFTLDNRLPGPDHYFSLVPSELKAMVSAIRESTKMLGSGHKELLEAEGELYAYARRGLQAIREIHVGDHLVEGDNYDILRPGQQLLGAHPKRIDDIEGKQAKRGIALGQGLQEGDW